jgi:putative membrane protein insertion efficiency factor
MLFSSKDLFYYSLQNFCQVLPVSSNLSFCHITRRYSLFSFVKLLFVSFIIFVPIICSMIKVITDLFSFLLSLPVLLYRNSISPFLRPSCRHIPTCSQYMLDALKLHGPVRGVLFGIERILRCRPGGTHGYDPVPLIKFRRYRTISSMLKGWEKENRLKR